MIEPVGKKRNKRRGSTWHEHARMHVVSCTVITCCRSRALYNRDEFVFPTSIRLSVRTPACIGRRWRDYFQFQIFFDGESALRLRGRQIGEFAVPRGSVGQSQSNQTPHPPHHQYPRHQRITASSLNQAKPSTTVLGIRVCTPLSPPTRCINEAIF